jgi:hypothetical protein
MDIIDFTKKRLNSKRDGLPITVSPHYGPNGQHTKFPNNRSLALPARLT